MEDQKILFYYPQTAELNTQVRDIGRCEAVIKFSSTFHSDEKCEVVHTLKTRQYLLEPEENFFVVLTVKLEPDPGGPDGRNEEPNDDILASMLDHAYGMYRLFYDSFSACIAKDDVEVLRNRLSYFYSRYLQTLSFERLCIADVYRGIQFLPLDRLAFLRVQNFLAALEESFSVIRHSVFMYQDYLVWSGLEQHDMQCVYHYLVTSLFPSSSEQDQTFSPPRYLTGPLDLWSPGTMGKLPRVFLNQASPDGPTECTLVVYRSLNSTVILFVDGCVDLRFEWFAALDLVLAPRLTALSHELSDQCAARKSQSSSSQEQDLRFIYFNKLNLACKSTLHQASGIFRTLNGFGYNADVVALADLHIELNRVRDGEIIVRSPSESWIVGRKSDNRQFFVILQEKNYNLIDVAEEIKRLCNTQFSNIFLAD